MSQLERLAPEGIRQRGPQPRGARLVFVRHAESHANERGVAGGPTGDGGLTARGRAQAKCLEERLRISHELDDATSLYCSTLPRAWETARELSPVWSLTPRVLEDIDELRVGEADGLTWTQIAQRWVVPDWEVDPDAPCLPGGESLLGFYQRCSGAIDHLVATHPDQRIVVVSHGGFIEQALKRYQGSEPARRLGLRIEHCSLTEIEYFEGRERLLRFNDQTPLALRA